jgi:hypothetical protein
MRTPPVGAEPEIATASSAGGALLASGVRALAALRRAPKPFHPRGRVATGVVRRHGGGPPTGVPWLQEMGEDPVLVRVSRAVGLPAPAPDIFGIALRIPGERGPSDLLLATTGSSVVTRFLLTPHREGHERTYGSLLPYRSPTGPVVLGAVRTGERTFELRWARPAGRWNTYGSLELDRDPGEDEEISFDPVANPLPGLENYEWVRRLRQPSYRVARRSSGRA